MHINTEMMFLNALFLVFDCFIYLCRKDITRYSSNIHKTIPSLSKSEIIHVKQKKKKNPIQL